MATGVNKVILVGRLGKDPEIRYTSAGAAVVNFSLATSEHHTTKTGEKKERTEWHKVVVWGKHAELCNQYLRKGAQVYIEGKLQTREWVGRENLKHYTTEINAQSVQFLGGMERAAPAALEYAQPEPSYDDEIPF